MDNDMDLTLITSSLLLLLIPIAIFVSLAILLAILSKREQKQKQADEQKQAIERQRQAIERQRQEYEQRQAYERYRQADEQRQAYERQRQADEQKQAIENMKNWLNNLHRRNCTYVKEQLYTDGKLLERFIEKFRFLKIGPVYHLGYPDRNLMRPYIKIKIYGNQLLIHYKETGLENHARVYYAVNTVTHDDIQQIELFFNVNKRRPISPKLRDEILRRDNFTCRHCGRSAPNVKLHIDHIIPVSKGGATVPDNLQTLCEECNFGKGNKYSG
jgi:hypothetical protein